MMRRDIQALGHVGDDKGLGDGLLALDGQRLVGIGVRF